MLTFLMTNQPHTVKPVLSGHSSFKIGLWLWLVMAIYMAPILGYSYSKVLYISQLIVSHIILERVKSWVA